MNPRDFAERALLGVLLLEPGRIRNLTWLQSTDFQSSPHEIVYRNLAEMVADADADAEHNRAAENDEMLAGLVEELDHAEAEQHQVPEVGPVVLFDRIRSSGELGTTTSTVLTAPGLHTMMATAPAAHLAQPEAYGLMILESSIRRQVSEAGMRVGRAAETSAELDTVLEVVGDALDQVSDAQDRWDAGTHTHRITLPTERTATTAVDSAAQTTLTDEDIQNAEWGLVENVVAQPSMLDDLSERVRPSDFGDPQLANTYRAAMAVHAESHATGHRVDAVTVAWQLQRQHAQHGDGLPIEDLAHMGHTIPVANAEHCADRVMRGSVTRLTQNAARSVQDAAQTPGLQPGDVLHTATAALDAVQSTAHRAGQRGSIAAQLAGTAAPAPASPRVTNGKTESEADHRIPTITALSNTPADRDR